jgi:hypothetical protein
MAVNRLQKNKGPNKFTLSPKRFKAKLSKKIFFKGEHIRFFSNSDRDFYSEKNNIHLETKNTKRK